VMVGAKAPAIVGRVNHSRIVSGVHMIAPGIPLPSTFPAVPFSAEGLPEADTPVPVEGRSGERARSERCRKSFTPGGEAPFPFQYGREPDCGGEPSSQACAGTHVPAAESEAWLAMSRGP